MTTERITFTGHNGADLAARLDFPDGPHLATALFAHCFTCSKDIPAARRISARLAGMGIAVLRFDFTGLGHSGGEFGNTTFTSNVGDLHAAADHLAGMGHAPALLIGHSLGGRGGPQSRRRHRIRQSRRHHRRAVRARPTSPTTLAMRWSRSAATDKPRSIWAARPITISEDFVDDVSAEKLGPAIASLRRALLVLHAPQDRIVGIENASNIFLAAKHPKSFVTLDEADHLITRPEDAEYAAEVIAAWASRYLKLTPPAPPPGAPEGVVRVSEADPNGFLQDVNAGPTHHALADEPEAYGGDQSRHDALRLPDGWTGRLHLNDHPHVRPTQEMAAYPRQR